MAELENTPLFLQQEKHTLSNTTLMGCERNGTKLDFYYGVIFFGWFIPIPITRSFFMRAFLSWRMFPMPSDITTEQATAFVNTDIIYTNGWRFIIAEKDEENVE